MMVAFALRRLCPNPRCRCDLSSVPDLEPGDYVVCARCYEVAEMTGLELRPVNVAEQPPECREALRVAKRHVERHRGGN